MSDTASFEAIVEQILTGEAPPQLRTAAARGALPLPRAVLVRLYVALRGDEDAAIRDQAEASLGALETGTIAEVLRDESCTPAVLEFFAPRATKDEALAEPIAFHAAAPPAALEALARSGSAKVIELVLTNQERLLRQPELLGLLSNNPALRADQRGRILELLERASRVAERDPTAAPEEDGEEVSTDFEEAARLLQVDVGELLASSAIEGGEEFAQSEDPEIRSAYSKILTLNTAQKAILALRGGREERMILVRDTNKLVSLAVLRNPRIVEEDVEAYSRMRNVSGEVLRVIGTNREWVKNYSVLRSLIGNPRTPQGVSMNFVARLQNQDLKKLIRNHDVPELIRRMAKRTLDTRLQPQSGIRRKH